VGLGAAQVKFLVCHPGPNFSVADVHTGWVEALQGLGHHVDVFNLDDRLNFYDNAMLPMRGLDENGYPQVRKAFDHEQAIRMAVDGLLNICMLTWPDVIMIISAFFTPPQLLDVLRGRGFKVVLLHTESPYQDAEQIKRAAHADVNLLNDPMNLPSFQLVCKTSEYMPHAYRPSLHKPGKPVPTLMCDLAFVGTGYQSRVSFFEAMDLKGLDVLLGGNWTLLDRPKDEPPSPLLAYVAHAPDECLDNEQTVQVYRSAKCGINFYRREGESETVAVGYAIGPREIEMAATGLFFLRDPRPESDELLPMLPTFDSPEDASEKLRFWLAHPEWMEGNARQAREAVAGRTFENNAKRLMELLDKL